MWLMKTLLTSGCVNQRGAGHAAQQYAENNQHITNKLSAFTAARDTHAASMQVLKEIDTSMERCEGVADRSR